MPDPDIEAAFNDDNIGKLLKPEDRRPLYHFIRNLKGKKQKLAEEETKRADQGHLISEKGLMYVNQKTYDLH